MPSAAIQKQIDAVYAIQRLNEFGTIQDYSSWIKIRSGWNTKIHMVAAYARTAMTFALSPGNAHDAPKGLAPLSELGSMPEKVCLLMDRAYDGDETSQLVLGLGMIPVVPPQVQPHRVMGIRPRPLQEAQ